MSQGLATWKSSTENIPDYPRWQRVVKRVLDTVLAFLLLIIVVPLWLFIALWIRLDSPGPALFKQTRMGIYGKPYTIYKFRTMVTHADQITKQRLAKVKDLKGFVFQEEGDPRITRSGRFLRKTSLDELPQLLNILGGTMSLVGPRPEIPEIASRYTPEQRGRLRVLPGITGLAQINGRSDLTFEETMAFDLEYVHTWTLGLDLKILWHTIFVVLTGRGAR